MKTADPHTGRGLFVSHDEPTELDLSQVPTLPDVRRRASQRPPAPKWPIPIKSEQQPAARGRSSFWWMIATTLGASVALLLSLLSLLGVINLTSHTGIFAALSPAGQSTPRASTTASPTANAAPGSGWLQVSPADVQFGCSDHQRTQIVVLQNHGSGHVHWHASLSVPADQAGVAISPGDGDLGAGESTAIQLQSTSQSARQQEFIHFTVTDSQQAGAPASVSFTAVGCG